MNLAPGKYLIVTRAHWTREDSKVLIIEAIDKQADVILYWYPEDKEGSLRERDYFDFNNIELVPLSSLIEELI